MAYPSAVWADVTTKHAYKIVRCERSERVQSDEEAPDEHFTTMIDAVHQRAITMFRFSIRPLDQTSILTAQECITWRQENDLWNSDSSSCHSVSSSC